jgi:hypothetical protein
MKKVFTLIAVALALTTPAFAQKDTKGAKVQPTPTAPIAWEFKAHDFGTVKMGPTADVTFKFIINSNAPVVISNAAPSCGCTTPTWTKTPIMPGETGEVKASYGTEGRPGYFQKSVAVTLDNGDTANLTISGTVVQDKK